MKKNMIVISLFLSFTNPLFMKNSVLTMPYQNDTKKKRLYSRHGLKNGSGQQKLNGTGPRSKTDKCPRSKMDKK